MLLRIVSVIVLVIALILGTIFLLGKRVDLKAEPAVVAVGESTPISFTVTAPHGVKRFTAVLEQSGQRQVLVDDRQKSKDTKRVYHFLAGRKQAAFLKEGDAKLTVTAKSNDLRGAHTTVTTDVHVILRPPSITADGLQHYINQGGAELVLVEVGGDWTEAGVRIGPDVARTFPLPGQPEDSKTRFSLFPYSYALPPDTIPVVFARNAAGTEATATFWTKVFPKTFHDSIIDVTTENMQKVVTDIDPNGTGDLVQRFVHLNRDMRKDNNQTLADLRLKTEHKILWDGPFEPILGKRESYFADHRTYKFDGKKIDEQVHLGFDIAAHEHMPVKVANSGKVVYAERLGIYGNCVVVDHGYGLQTLYGHMSRIDVKVGDMVTKKQSLGLSGSTGMAFGDHVHFSMLVEGVQVNPIEWWDEHWIHDRILSKIGPEALKKKDVMAGPVMSKETKTTPRVAKKHHR
jgi:murein DD-endopeptidase MepM/ murein hydrolase activator NlpD